MKLYVEKQNTVTRQDMCSLTMLIVGHKNAYYFKQNLIPSLSVIGAASLLCIWRRCLGMQARLVRKAQGCKVPLLPHQDALALQPALTSWKAGPNMSFVRTRWTEPTPSSDQTGKSR